MAVYYKESEIRFKHIRRLRYLINTRTFGIQNPILIRANSQMVSLLVKYFYFEL